MLRAVHGFLSPENNPTNEVLLVIAYSFKGGVL